MLIFLVGFMGAGKTYWGKQWAYTNKFPFYDLDVLIENRESSTVANIFKEKGEDHFRTLETELLEAFQFSSNAIIACGGGTPCFNNNMEWMNRNGITIFLKASPLEIVARLEGGVKKRPLLSGKSGETLLKFVEQKLKERAQCYEAAEHTFEVKHLNTSSLHAIIASYQHNA